ncbi:MAG: hypothetical protein Q9226_003956 [Calogaya cf. arnoldii]
MRSRWILHLFLYLLPLIYASPADPPISLPSDEHPEGNILQFDDSIQEPDDYSICTGRGNDYWNRLTSTLLKPAAKDRTNGYALFQEHYIAKYSPEKWPGVDLAVDLKDDGVDATSMDLWFTTDKIPRESDEDYPYQNYFNTRDGVIIAALNFRMSDEARLLNWSELLYHTWLVAEKRANQQAKEGRHIPGGPISNLRTVIQESVVNGQT